MIGQTISHYRITRRLGAGGMGIVYEATDLNLDRSVALKFLPADLTRDPEAKARFVHEAKTASALDHPNICTVHEIGETDDGRLFITMACYDGESLRERVARGPLPLEEALEIAQQVAAGLAKTHEQGIVHRDIKPANIFVTQDGLVKIVDFGLAKLAGHTKLTRTGTIMGTVAYLAPELAQGADADPRSDLWSLGAVLYEMITGRAPFRGDHEQAVIYAIVNQELQPARSLRDEIPPELEQILTKCLAKDPDARYATAGEIAGDLHRLRQGTTDGITVSPRSGIGFTTAARSRRRRLGIGLAALAAVAGLSAWLLLQPKSRTLDADAMSLAVVAFEDLADPDDTSRAAGLSFLLNTSLIEGSPIRVVSASLIDDVYRRRFGEAHGTMQREHALEVARAAQATYLLTGAIVPQQTGALVTWQLVDTSDGASLGGDRLPLTDLATLTDEIVAGVIPTLARSCGIEAVAAPIEAASLVSSSPEAYALYLAGTRAVHEYRLQEAIEALTRATELDSTFALAHFALSKALFLTRARDEFARKPAEQAWRLRDRLNVKDRLRLEAWRQRIDWHMAEALATLQEMRARWPDDRETLVDLVNLYHYMVYARSASRVATQALQLYPDDGYFLWINGTCLQTLGQFTTALAQSKAFLRLEPENPNAWDELGLRFLQVAATDSAEAAFRHALTLQEDFWPSEHGLASVAYCRGDLDSAVAVIQQLLAQEHVSRGQQVSMRTDLIYLDSLAFYLLEAGRVAETDEVFAQARAYVRGLEELARYLREYSWFLVRSGRPRAALACADSLRPFAVTSRYARVAIQDIEVRALVALDSLGAAEQAIAAMRQLEDIWGCDARNLADLAAAQIALKTSAYQRAAVHLEGMLEEGIPRLNLYELEWYDAWIASRRLAGRLAEAEAALLELLNRYAGHYLGRYQLGQVYEEMGRSDAAIQQYEIFLNGWSQADAQLAQLADAKLRLAKLKAGTR